jgi:hypothetical protein
MATKPLSPSPEKMENDAPQQVDTDVMDLIKRKDSPEQSPEVLKAKNDLRRIIKEVGIDPMRIVMAGKYAEEALTNPSMYPIAIEVAIRENLISESDIQPGGINYKLLAAGITAGKLTQELLDEGAL